MDLRISAGLLALSLAFPPDPAGAQLVLRDDVSGWGWLTVVTDRDAIVQLAYGSPQSGAQGRLDAELLQELRSRGVRRVFDQSSFDAAESQVMAECSGMDWIPDGTELVNFGLHVEISYWDHTRLAATEIYEAMTLGSVVREVFSPAAYVDGCAQLLTEILFRLGFDQG